MSLGTSQQPKQIKQYRDFTTLTSIRKATQDAMAPTIKSLQEQISALMAQNKETNRKMSKIQDIFKTQNHIQSRIEETNKIIRQFKQEQAQKRKEDQRKSSRLDSANQKLFIEIHSMKTGLDHYNQIYNQMNNKTTKVHDMYTGLSTANETAIKQMQYKYTEFCKQVLSLQKNIKSDQHKIERQAQMMSQTFRIQREALQQKSKSIDLYFSERQVINQKFQQIYSKLISSVTKQDFEAYRKSQKLHISEQFQLISNQIKQVLPQSLRKQLPLIVQKLKQVQKLKGIQDYCSNLSKDLDHTIKKITTLSDGLNSKIQEANQKIGEKFEILQKDLSQKIQQIDQKHLVNFSNIEQKIGLIKVQIQEQLLQKMQKQKLQIEKAIKMQIGNNKSSSQVVYQPKIEMYEQQLRKLIQDVRNIQQKILSRYQKIQEIGNNIDKKIQGYSSKITRIKSDYELFAENTRKQISGVIKFRQTFLDKLKDIGRILSSFIQALFVLSSVALQTINESSITKKHEYKQPIVFITDFDGIIFQWKPQNEKGYIYYRRQKMQTKQFMSSFMYSLITFADDLFLNYQFLDWKNLKPSAFFQERILENYQICVKKKIQNPSKRMQDLRQQNKSQKQENFELDLFEDHGQTSSTKQFSKTIDDKNRICNPLQEANLLISVEQNKKLYNIKRPKPCSSRPKSKQKANIDSSRYDQMFLTSRSACRSRISQLL